MHRLIPEFIQERYSSNQKSGLFEACALFVDISGFTTITDAIMGHGQHGAELLANIIGEVFDPLMKSVFEQGGFVTNLAGDAFTAVFPLEAESRDGLIRALVAAWQIQQLVGGSSQHRTPYGNFTVSVKVGVAAGEVAWGIISSPGNDRATYYFQGPAIDGCANAEKLAKAGEIIVAANVLKDLRSMVVAEPSGDHFRITAFNGPLPVPLSITLRPVDPDIMIRFFPLEATRPTVSGEFRQVVSMFISLPTVRTVEQLAMFIQIIFELQDRYGGLLNRLNFGDKGANLLLFWGAPLAFENDLIRALNFILDLQSQTVIPVKVGITYHIAHGGYSGGTLAGEYTCHGRGTTLAARLMQVSSRGEIWVDENVAVRAENRFELDFEGDMTFKGFTKKQKVFILLEHREEIDPFYEGNTVGREVERDRLVDFAKPIWQGHFPGAMVVWGEPGIGKSRLVHDFIQYLKNTTNNDFTFFICQTDEILREPLNPFRYWLRGYFGQSEQQSDARNKRSFNRLLDRLIATTPEDTLTRELDRTRSFLGALVNLDWPDSLYEQLDAQGRYENSLTGLLTLLQAESLHRPVILLLDDAHWLDEDSKAFLHQLIQVMARGQTYPLAILATARREGERTVLGDDITYQEIELGQLSPDDVASLASTQLGAPIGPNLLELLVERAEGNPFFAEQILRYMQEQELLLVEEGEWKLEQEQQSAMPSDVSAILVSRLDRLTHEVKEIVQTASVLGREFEVRLLARMLDDDPTVGEKVVQAEQLSIWSSLNELRYLFKHVLLRDAAYHMQLRSRRQILHKLAAKALEDLYVDDLSPHFGELAYHAEQAQLIDKARHYLELAGDSAKDGYQNSKALDYYSRALELTPDDDLESRYRLLSARVRLQYRLGLHRDQVQDLNEMTQLAERLEDVSKQVKALIQKAWMFWWTAEYTEGIVATRQATILAEAAGEPGLVSQANHVTSWTLIQQGEYAAARPLSEKALASARQSGDQHLEADVLSGLGLINRVEGDFLAGSKSAEEALAISRSIGDWPGEATSLGNLGVALMTLGDYEAAKINFQQALLISREIGAKAHTASDLINLCWNAQTQGEWESAIDYGEEGIAIVRRINQTEMEAEVLIWLGHAWLGLDQPKKALVVYQESLRLRRELGQQNLAMGVLAGMAQAALAQDDLPAASQYVEEIITFLESSGSLDGAWEPLRIYLACFQVLQLSQDSRAGEILETAYQKLQGWAKMITDVKVRRMFLENVPWHREIVMAYDDMTS